MNLNGQHIHCIEIDSVNLTIQIFKELTSVCVTSKLFCCTFLHFASHEQFFLISCPNKAQHELASLNSRVSKGNTITQKRRNF